jgi:hypothetical protein
MPLPVYRENSVSLSGHFGVETALIREILLMARRKLKEHSLRSMCRFGNTQYSQNQKLRDKPIRLTEFFSQLLELGLSQELLLKLRSQL